MLQKPKKTIITIAISLTIGIAIGIIIGYPVIRFIWPSLVIESAMEKSPSINILFKKNKLGETVLKYDNDIIKNFRLNNESVTQIKNLIARSYINTDNDHKRVLLVKIATLSNGESRYFLETWQRKNLTWHLTASELWHPSPVPVWIMNPDLEIK
ncbi:hypothetical protein OpiT1DRAFT_04719 [Opitutaceae bacterium TAV1]|nr:hypothetical protein OpiT1DRAFT_04719 [Opitutaceae bacterium TAV1]